MISPPSNRPASPITRRLGMYLLGIAIGLILVGFLLSARQVMFRPQAPAPQGETPR